MGLLVRATPTGGSTDYDNINGTEGNGSGDRIDDIRKPDTEDLDGDGILDLGNDYYRYVIYLGDNSESTEYIADGADNPNGWRLYRIPMDEFQSKVGDPDIWDVKFVRIWITDIPERAKISIY
ncbi:hypothetical protein ACFL6G_10230 [candidate division KSB1 bacterium]